jgi:acyl-[acyl-carrier-protein]-phospholipid O-acyltransferase/long-chain-fatty-acid--[acyl-carrier-protein] ligase
MEMVSFLGMLCGTMFASFFADTLSSWELGMTFLLVSGLGFAGSLFIKAKESPTVEDSDTVRPIKYLLGSIREARKYRGLNSTIVALSVFWFMAAIVQMTLLVFCRRNLEMTDFQTGIVLTLAAIGTGIGCFVSGVLSKKGNRNRIVTLSGTGISILFLFIFVYPVKGPVFGLILFVTGFLCGLFKVPFDSAIIEKVPGRALGHMLAYSNQLSFLFILAGSGAFALITGFLGTSFIFLFLALVMGSTTLYVTFSKYLCACNSRKQT